MIPVWDAGWMTTGSGDTRYDPGLDLALRQAAGFPLVLAHYMTYQPYVAQMRAVNPNLQLIAYMNATFAPKGDGGYPEEWYAHDAAGSRITSYGWGTYLMDPESEGWAGEVVALSRDRIAASGYDGVFLDVLGISGLSPGYVTSLPVNAGETWTKADWYAATGYLAEKVYAELHVPVFGNGLGNGSRYFGVPPSSVLLEPLDGCMAESFVRGAFDPADEYRGESAWRKDVDMLADAALRGGSVLAITKLWVDATEAKRVAWADYALATFLLGYEPGHAWFSFRDDRLPTKAWPGWTVDLGPPVGAYAKIGELYRRQFERGHVLVSPVAHTGRVMRLRVTSR